jgi:hypothetical protein
MTRPLETKVRRGVPGGFARGVVVEFFFVAV